MKRRNLLQMIGLAPAAALAPATAEATPVYRSSTTPTINKTGRALRRAVVENWDYGRSFGDPDPEKDYEDDA